MMGNYLKEKQENYFPPSPEGAVIMQGTTTVLRLRGTTTASSPLSPAWSYAGATSTTSPDTMLRPFIDLRRRISSLEEKPPTWKNMHAFIRE